MTDAQSHIAEQLRSILKPVKSVKDLNPTVGTRSLTVNSPPNAGGDTIMASLMHLATNDQIMSNISSAEFAWKKIIVKGHMAVICAKGNGGKTTIMIQAAADMSAAGMQVFYVNVDASASDLMWYHDHATEHGYALIAPDLHEGKGVDDVVVLLREMARDGRERNNMVIILDTLKKFTDVISKTRAKEFYGLLRKLTAQGVTIICLAHTNKYNDVDGMPVFEGTGDLRNDFDELIYLLPLKNEDGTITVTTKIDKMRAQGMRDTSFSIGVDREVTEIPLVDTLSMRQDLKMREDYRDEIEFILNSIAHDCQTCHGLTDISKANKSGFDHRRLKRVLEFFDKRNHDKPLWDSAVGVRNGRYYFPLGKGQDVPSYAQNACADPPALLDQMPL